MTGDGHAGPAGGQQRRSAAALRRRRRRRRPLLRRGGHLGLERHVDHHRRRRRRRRRAPGPGRGQRRPPTCSTSIPVRPNGRSPRRRRGDRQRLAGGRPAVRRRRRGRRREGRPGGPRGRDRADAHLLRHGHRHVRHHAALGVGLPEPLHGHRRRRTSTATASRTSSGSTRRRAAALPRDGSARSSARPASSASTCRGTDNAFVVGDVNRDGYADVVARDTATGNLELWTDPGRSSTPTAPRVIGTGWSGMNLIAPAGDLTMDGVPGHPGPLGEHGDALRLPAHVDRWRSRSPTSSLQAWAR